ncbi:hypothetical protein SDC9_210189 [bioreactor metagenome]|uniref:Uncharacterized protein n=1 Tax=bioreactor metagenome TaxID=1076179 RepID=A0A645JFR0_9ZZZZ
MTFNQTDVVFAYVNIYPSFFLGHTKDDIAIYNNVLWQTIFNAIENSPHFYAVVFITCDKNVNSFDTATFLNVKYSPDFSTYKVVVAILFLCEKRDEKSFCSSVSYAYFNFL